MFKKLVFPCALAAAVLGIGVWLDHVAIDAPEAASTSILSQRGELGRAQASQQVRMVAQWAVESRDHAGLPFVIVDKEAARLYAFDARGRLAASAPVLLGASRDDAFLPTAAATPAGRFSGDSWRSGHSAGAIVWVGEHGSVKLEPPSNDRGPGRAALRLASANAGDNRISDGSLHVDPAFFGRHLAALRTEPSVAYVLPEVRSLRETFKPGGSHMLIAAVPPTQRKPA